MATRTTKITIGFAAVIVIAVGAVFGIRALWNSAQSQFITDTCTVGAYDVDPSQAAVASTMVGAVTKYPRHVGRRAAVLVLAAGLQESKLRNLPPGQGDRDSVGVLQQRPSQGWGGGDPQKLTDVGEATKEFLDALTKINGWQQLSLADAVQRVQISADGSAYAQHEQEAAQLADALMGLKPAAISCNFAAPSQVAPAATVAAQARRQLGITSPVAAGETVRATGAGWQTVAWFVANADRLGIEQVDYADKRWTRTGGWKSGVPRSAAVTATMYKKSGAG